MLYFRIKNPIGKTTKEKNGLFSSLLIKGLKFILPNANPDFDDLYTKEVNFWFIEFYYEEETYYVNREIGLNDKDIPVVVGPYKENYGFWTDSKLDINSFKDMEGYKVINYEEFEREWKNALLLIKNID